MIKVVYFMKRKPGISHEEFREHFDFHVKLSVSRFGHLLLQHHRNYPARVTQGRAAAGQPANWDYDCISEWFLADQAALDQIIAILADPVTGKEFYDDAAKFLDADGTIMIRCDDVEVIAPATAAP